MTNAELRMNWSAKTCDGSSDVGAKTAEIKPELSWECRSSKIVLESLLSERRGILRA